MKLLVISLAGIGDTLIATPLIHELRLAYPEARLDLFVLWSGSREILEGNPHVNQVWQKNLIESGVAGSLPFLGRLRRERYDISLNTHPQSRLAYRVIARMIGAPVRLSHAYDHHGWLDRRLVNRSIPQDYTVHGVENNLRLLSLLGKEPQDPRRDMELFLSEKEESFAREWVGRMNLEERRLLGVHVGSGGTKNLALKRWPLGHYKELLRRLGKSRPDVTVLLFGGPGEREAHREVEREVGGPRLFVPETGSLRQAAALIKRCHAFLSVDTALMHLAAAMKVPHQVVIEAPTLNATNVPWNHPHRVVPNPAVGGRNLDYYRYDGKPIQGSDAELRQLMESVTVDSVEQTLHEVL